MELSSLEKRIMEDIRDHGIWAGETAMAKRLNISRETLSYKLDKLEQERVITGFNLRINPMKLGFREIAYVFFKLKKQVNVDKVYSYILAHNHVQSAILATGEYDFVSKVLFHDSRDLHSFMVDVQNRLKNYVEDMHVTIATQVYKLHSICLSAGDAEYFRPCEKDMELLSILFDNPRASIKEVAKQARMHRNTVSRRLNQLYGRRVILKLAAKVNKEYYNQLGMGFWAIVQFDAETGFVDELAGKLSEMKEVHELYAVTGPHDLIAIIRVDDARSYSNFGKQIFGMPHMGRMLTSVVFQSEEKPLSPRQLTS